MELFYRLFVLFVTTLSLFPMHPDLTVPCAVDTALIAPQQIQMTKTPLSNVVWHPDSDTLAVSGLNGINLYSLENASLWPQRISGDDLAMAWKPDGRSLAGSGNTVWIWSRDEGTRILADAPRYRSYVSIAWHPTEDYLAASGRGINTTDNQIWIWDIKTGELKATLAGDNARPADNAYGSIGYDGLDWSGDGLHLAAYSQNNDHLVWDFETLSPSQAFDDQHFDSGLLQFSPDGSRLLNTNRAGIVIYNVNDGSLVTTLSDLGPVDEADWSPDGAMIIARSYWHQQVSVWDVNRGTVLAEFKIPQAETYGNLIDWRSAHEVAIAGLTNIALVDLTDLPQCDLQLIETKAAGNLQWSPDQQKLALYGSHGLLVFMIDN